MTFHGLITGLVVLAVLLALATLESWRRSRRRANDWYYYERPDAERLSRWTASLEDMVAALEANRVSAGQARVAFDRLGVLLSDFRYWRDEWGWEQ